VREKIEALAQGITGRREPAELQEKKQARPERSRLPSNETTQFVVSIGSLVSVIADTCNLVPGKVDAIAAGALAAVVSGVAWGNKRWKDKYGDQSKD
jgi:hypothetical protein